MKSKTTQQEKAWILYDWANSSFATTVMAGFFPLFFQKYWSSHESSVDSTGRLGLMISLSGAAATILTLLIGPHSDRKNSRKFWTLISGFVAIIAIFGFWFFPEGEWQGPLILYSVALTGFTLSCNFYDSLLPHVTNQSDEHHTNWISAMGYSFGYLGGGLLFLFNVILFVKHELFGITDSGTAVKICFVSVAIWWFLFSIPMAVKVSEKGSDEHDFMKGREIVELLKEALTHKRLFYFLVAFWFYIDGVYTVMSMAVDFGAGIGLEGKDLMGALLMTQFVAFPFTLLSSKLSSRFGIEKTLSFLVFLYIIGTLAATQIQTGLHFFLLAGLIGMAQGGVQSLSRSHLANLVPKHESGKWYALMNVVGRFGAILGPFLVGLFTQISGSHRWGVSAIAILLIVGIYFLFKSSSAREFSR